MRLRERKPLEGPAGEQRRDLHIEARAASVWVDFARLSQRGVSSLKGAAVLSLACHLGTKQGGVASAIGEDSELEMTFQVIQPLAEGLRSGGEVIYSVYCNQSVSKSGFKPRTWVSQEVPLHTRISMSLHSLPCRRPFRCPLSLQLGQVPLLAAAGGADATHSRWGRYPWELASVYSPGRLCCRKPYSPGSPRICSGLPRRPHSLQRTGPLVPSSLPLSVSPSVLVTPLRWSPSLQGALPQQLHYSPSLGPGLGITCSAARQPCLISLCNPSSRSDSLEALLTQGDSLSGHLPVLNLRQSCPPARLAALGM